MSTVDEFLATVAGAAVAGMVGLITLLTQQYLERRHKQSEEILGPAFSYVMGIPEHPTWSGIGEAPWGGIDSYHWLRVPARHRQTLSEMSKRLGQYGVEWGHYFQFTGGPAHKSIVEATRKGLAGYTTEDGAAVLTERLGIEGGAVIDINWIAVAVLPYVVMNPSAPDRAWDQLLKEGPDTSYWAKQVIQSLQTRDPPALYRLFDEVAQIPETAKARDLVKVFREAQQKVYEQALVVRGLLAKRLGVRPGKPGGAQ